MINSVTDTSAALTEIRTSTSSCVSEVDFEDTLMEAVSVAEGEGYADEPVSGKMTLSGIFEAASRKYNVPLDLLTAMAKQESNFNTTSVSHAGAQGIMQLMPATARSLGVTDSFNAWQNIMGGARYISQKLEMYDGNVTLALAAYNAGSGNVSKYGGVPPFEETQNYIRKVLSYMEEGVSVPDVTVSVSEAASAVSSVKRQSQANNLEIRIEDGEETSPVQQLLASSSTNLSDVVSEKLQLYLQEQQKTSVSSLMEKLLMEQGNGEQYDS